MEGTNSFSLSDIRAATRDNDGYNDGWGWGGGSGIWVILLFLVMFGAGGFGGGWGANNSTLSTDFAVLERKLDGVNNGLCDGFYAINNAIKDGDYALARDIQTVAAAQAQCCCETNRNIDAVRYDAQKNTCDIITAIHQDGEATRALFREQEIQALRDKVGGLELSQALCGVVRYPNAITYTAGYSPFCANSCGGYGNGLANI